jgi:hypothetical protein
VAAVEPAKSGGKATDDRLTLRSISGRQTLRSNFAQHRSPAVPVKCLCNDLGYRIPALSAFAVQTRTAASVRRLPAKTFRIIADPPLQSRGHSAAAKSCDAAKSVTRAFAPSKRALFWSCYDTHHFDEHSLSVAFGRDDFEPASLCDGRDPGSARFLGSYRFTGLSSPCKIHSARLLRLCQPR